MSHCQSVRYALGIYAICFLLNGISTAEDTVREQYTVLSRAIEPEGRALFNPRVDYNQWTPVGHSDPLKNDPTFDYVPPTSGNVRYWSESAEGKSNENTVAAAVNKTHEKSEILLLGVPMEHSDYSNHLPQPEVKSANRRSSPYYPPEPSRHLTPPSQQAYTSSYDQSGAYNSNKYYTSKFYNEELPVTYSSDAFPDESAAYVTVIRPKTNPHPYASTIYNKNVRNNVYHLAANVNSLEQEKKNPYWIQSLLQKEITFPVQPTTPTIVPSYSTHVYEPQSSNVNLKVEAPPQDTFRIEHSFAEPTTTQLPLTTDSLFSHYKQPVLPVRGPMYLIYQGHSKVKTYGAGDKSAKQEVKMVPVTPRDETIVKHVVLTNPNGEEIQVKHLHKIMTTVKPKPTPTKPVKKIANSPMDSLLSLLDSSLSSFGSMMDKSIKTKPTDAKKTTEKTTTLATTKAATTKTSTIFGPTTLRPLDSES